jgi:membrane protein YqaA with SNARE-associated domain
VWRVTEPEQAHPIDRALIVKTVVGLAVILLIAGIVGVVFKDPLEAAGRSFLDTFGLPGLFASVVITDGVPFPLTNEPLIFLARGAGVAAWLIFVIVSAASITAGAVGYWGGRLIGGSFGLEEWLERKQPALIYYMRKYGAEGVAIAALLPIPFQLSTWTAGTLHVAFPKVMLASLLRIVKTGFYVVLISWGLSFGA